jgi:6-phospho-3-hexuloisomerase
MSNTCAELSENAVITTILHELKHTADSISQSQLENLIKTILAHQRIFVYGKGRSGLMLKAFAMRLMQIGLVSYVVGETTTPSIRDDDLLMLASASGETSSVVLTAESARKRGADLLVITASRDSSLARLQNPDLIIKSGTKYSISTASVQPLGSLFEQSLLILFDAVILMMVRQGIASNSKMATRHASLE